jgi:hypothetical protein
MNFRSLNNFLEFNSENEIWKRGKQLIALGLILLAWSKGQHGPLLAHASGAAWARGRGDHHALPSRGGTDVVGGTADDA